MLSARVASGREWPAVIHCGRDGNAGRHLVVEQPPHERAKLRGNRTIEGIGGPILCTVNRPGQVAFERVDDLLQLLDVAGHDQQ